MSVGDFIRNSQVWKSIFRHPAPRDRRNRVVVMLTNVFLHLHPVSVRKSGIELSYTWCMGGITFFLFPNVLSEPPSKFKAGLPDTYEDSKVVDRYKDQNAWIVRYNGLIYALSTTCTHLGCTPNWLERESKFKCPCHGSGFYITGINFEGPAPRPLERWGISVGDDGQVVVDKSKKFQFERGEWTNPESFIKV